MADIADQAYEQNQAAFEAEQRAKRLPEGPKATGYCLDCTAPLDPGMRWCDAHCRDRYQLRVDAERRNGRGR